MLHYSVAVWHYLIRNDSRSMRIHFIAIGLLAISSGSVVAQRCFYTEHLQNETSSNPSLSFEVSKIESFIQQQRAVAGSARLTGTVIRIPVVVHILYHLPVEN